MKSPERNFARRIDLTSLQLFVAVCELAASAARRSGIHRRIGREQAPVRSGSRGRHRPALPPQPRVTLTPAGESLLHHARTVLFGLERMQGELSEYAEGVRPCAGARQHLGHLPVLPEDLGAFARQHSQIKIDLQEHLSTAVLHAVQEGAADLGICNVGMGSGGTQEPASRPTDLIA